jgi:hypothetical protein
MASFAAGNWHASFKSEDAMLMLGVNDAVTRAGGLFTVVHDAQRSATWFETWKAKCLMAKGVVICFTAAYCANFTPALMQEAGVILALYNAGLIKLYIVNPEDGTNAANVFSNIMTDSAGMGDIDAWIAFVTRNGVTEDAKVAGTTLPTPTTTTAYGGGATGPSGSVAVANNRKTKDAAAVLFEADAHKKPTTRAAFGLKSWDARRLRLFRDCLRYGTMVKGQFTEKPEKGPGKSPLPVNGAVEYEVGPAKSSGAEVTLRFFDANGHGALVATKTFRLESAARRDEFIAVLGKLKADHQRRGGYLGGRGNGGPAKVLNSPGKWDFFASRSRLDADAADVAADLHAACDEEGLAFWRKSKMRKQSEAARQEGVFCSDIFLAIVSETYFRCKDCVQEMRWAQEAEKPIQILVRIEDKQRVDAFFDMAPDDLSDLDSDNQIMMIREDPDFWDVSVRLVLETRGGGSRAAGAMTRSGETGGKARVHEIPEAKVGALNPPGVWRFFGSHTQRDLSSKRLASELRSECLNRGSSFWLDVKMKDKSEAAMKEVRTVISFITVCKTRR